MTSSLVFFPYALSYQSCANTISLSRARSSSVWPLSPVSFIYKAVMWNSVLTVCSPLLTVSTEPCRAANLSLKQCLEFWYTAEQSIHSLGESLLQYQSISDAAHISLSPLNHYIRFDVIRKTIMNPLIIHGRIVYLILMIISSSGAFVALLSIAFQKNDSSARGFLKG